MKLKIFFISVLLISLSFSLSFSSERKRVLYLNSYHVGMQWSDDITRGLIDTFKEYPNIELSIEHLDTKRFSIDAVRPKIDFLLFEKYKEYKQDLIIVSDDNGLQYLIDNFEKLPKVPILFLGINELTRVGEAAHLGMTGIVEVASFKETIDLIINLQPQLEEIIIVSDSAPTSKLHLDRVRSIHKYVDSSVKFTEYVNWNWDVMIDFLNSHDKNKTAALILSWNIDWEGVPVSPNNQFKRQRELNIPAYSMWKNEITNGGAVGGHVADGYLHGVEIAKRTVMVFKGVSPTDIPLESSGLGNISIINYKTLSKYGIDHKKIPVGSLVLEKPVSFYRKYYEHIWIGATFVFIQLVALILLYFILKERNRLSADVQEKEAELLVLRHMAEKECLIEKKDCPNIDEVFNTLSTVLHRIQVDA